VQIVAGDGRTVGLRENELVVRAVARIDVDAAAYGNGGTGRNGLDREQTFFPHDADWRRVGGAERRDRGSALALVPVHDRCRDHVAGTQVLAHNRRGGVHAIDVHHLGEAVGGVGPETEKVKVLRYTRGAFNAGEHLAAAAANRAHGGVLVLGKVVPNQVGGVPVDAEQHVVVQRPGQSRGAGCENQSQKKWKPEAPPKEIDHDADPYTPPCIVQCRQLLIPRTDRCGDLYASRLVLMHNPIGLA